MATTTDNLNYPNGITDIYLLEPYNDYPIHKLKKMIISRLNEPLKTDSTNFEVIQNVSLRNYQLSYLPSNFSSHLKNVISLDISENKLQEIPHSFKSLSKLEELLIDDNELSSLQQSLCTLKHLKKLSIARNKIQQLPDTFGHLTNLEYLDLSDNQLESLPHSCYQMNRLSTLNISKNKFTSMPEAVVNGMKNIHELNVSSNKKMLINQAPASIHLVKFEANDLYNANIFPHWILSIKYSELKEVFLNRTSFEKFHFPDEKSALQITNLSLIGSNLSDRYLYGIFSNLNRLEKVDLSNDDNFKFKNVFWTTPFEYMETYNTLKEISLKNTGLPNLPNCISNFQNLTKLDISHNVITWFPKEFTILDNLEILIMDNGKFVLLPQDIGSLINLKELRAAKNSICGLPNSIYDLAQLEVLDLYDNAITEISSKISLMPKLKQFDLEQNHVDPSEIKIRNIEYKNLKDSLYENLESDKQRLSGIKDVETEEYDNYSSTKGSHYTESCHSSSSDELEYEQEGAEEEREDWSSSSNEMDDDNDNFEPFKMTDEVKPAYLAASFALMANYYCPADNHTQSIRTLVAKTRAPMTTNTFEEGQFDDA